MTPRPTSRIESLEKRATAIEAGIIELSNDTAEELKVIHQDIKQLDEGMMTSFKKIGDTFIETTATKDDISSIHIRFDKVEGDIAELKGDITSMKATQEQILKLLQQKSGE
jgi:uncharacterized coiled-coil protein SlyX